MTRNADQTSPEHVFSFLVDALEQSDNDTCQYDDGNYLGELAFDLALSIPHAETVRDLPGTHAHLDRVLYIYARLLNADKLMPTFQYIMSVSILRGLRHLQNAGLIPDQTYILREHLLYGHHRNVRVAALEALSGTFAKKVLFGHTKKLR
jgi:hypothetical protein